MLTLDVLPRFLQKIPACCMDFCWLTITSYLYPDMRSIVLLCGMLSVILGQVPSLAWVELADTVYGIANAQDTFGVWIQSRSGNVRRFDRYEGGGGSRFLAAYDSVYLDGSDRVQLLRRYERGNPNDPFELSEERSFSYLGSPALRIDLVQGNPPGPVGYTLYYGLTIFEGSVAWQGGLEGGAIPTEAYPTGYLIGQWGDSVVGLVLFFSFKIARWARPGACDTFIVEAMGSVEDSGKICHTAGRIDSAIFADSRTYYSYDANNRPIRIVSVETSGSDTTFYTYDSQGQLIETRESGVDDNGPYQRRYLLRYGVGSTSLSSVLGGDCLFWDASQRRGALTCQPAGTFTALRLYDLQGRIVWQGSVRGGETFEVPLTLPPGLYYLHTDVGTARLYLMP
jgi:YD repeat-containing protein